MLLKLKDVVNNSLKMLAEGTLGACNHSDCRYVYDDGSRCTAGAGMTDEMIEYVWKQSFNQKNVRSLEDIHLDFEGHIEDLQNSHDEWANSKDTEHPDFTADNVECSKKKYVALLGEKLALIPSLYHEGACVAKD